MDSSYYSDEYLSDDYEVVTVIKTCKDKKKSTKYYAKENQKDRISPKDKRIIGQDDVDNQYEIIVKQDNNGTVDTEVTAEKNLSCNVENRNAEVSEQKNIQVETCHAEFDDIHKMAQHLKEPHLDKTAHEDDDDEIEHIGEEFSLKDGEDNMCVDFDTYNISQEKEMCSNNSQESVLNSNTSEKWTCSTQKQKKKGSVVERKKGESSKKTNKKKKIMDKCEKLEGLSFLTKKHDLSGNSETQICTRSKQRRVKEMNAERDLSLDSFQSQSEDNKTKKITKSVGKKQTKKKKANKQIDEDFEKERIVSLPEYTKVNDKRKISLDMEFSDDSSNTEDYLDRFFVGQSDALSDDVSDNDHFEKKIPDINTSSVTSDTSQDNTDNECYGKTNTKGSRLSFNTYSAQIKNGNKSDSGICGDDADDVKQEMKTEKKNGTTSIVQISRKNSNSLRKEYPCKAHGCHKVFSTPLKLYEHNKRMHEQDKLLSCEECGKTFTYQARLKVHKVLHQGKIYECWICQLSFKSPYYLKCHVTKVHKITDTGTLKKYEDRLALPKTVIKKDPQTHQCQDCDKVFPTRKKVNHHFNIVHRTKSFMCEECGAFFSFQSLLDRHVKEKHSHFRAVIECCTCKKVFYRIDSLRLHLKTYHNVLNDIPGDCLEHMKRVVRNDKDASEWNTPLPQICKLKSGLDLSLKVIERQQITNPKFGTYTSGVSKDFFIDDNGHKRCLCNICGKTVSYAHLSFHKATHTGVFSIWCDQCGKGYYKNSQLKKHMRIHTGEKPYQCDQCQKTFRQGQALTRHKAVHAGLKPYKCTICGRAFNRLSTLQQHNKSQHYSD